MLQASECVDHSELVIKAISGEIQCAVASRTSSIMSKYTPISGQLMVMLEDYKLPPEGFLDFHLGDHRFAISLEHEKNLFFNKKKLIKTIEGDKEWLVYKDEISKIMEEFAPKQKTTPKQKVVPKQQKDVVLPIELLGLIQQRQIERLVQRHKIETGLVGGTYAQSPPIDTSTNIYTLLKQYHEDIKNVEKEYSEKLKSVENAGKIEDLDKIVLPFKLNKKDWRFELIRNLKKEIISRLDKYVKEYKENVLKQSSFKSCLTKEALDANFSSMFNKALENIAKRNIENVNKDPNLLKEQQKFELEHLKEIQEFEKYILIQQQNFLESSQANLEEERLKFEEFIFSKRQEFEQSEFKKCVSTGKYKLTPELFDEKQRIDKELFDKRKNILKSNESEEEKEKFIELLNCEILKRKRDFKEKVMQELGILKEIESQNITSPQIKAAANSKKSSPQSASFAEEDYNYYSDYSNEQLKITDSKKGKNSLASVENLKKTF